MLQISLEALQELVLPSWVCWVAIQASSSQTASGIGHFKHYTVGWVTGRMLGCKGIGNVSCLMLQR